MFVSYLHDYKLKALEGSEVLVFLADESTVANASAFEAKALSIIEGIEAPGRHIHTFHVGGFDASRRNLRMLDNGDITIAPHSFAQLHKVKNYQIILITGKRLNIILIPTTPIIRWTKTLAAVIKFSVTTTLKKN